MSFPLISRIKTIIGVAIRNLRKPKPIGSISSVAVLTTIKELAHTKDIRASRKEMIILSFMKEGNVALFINKFHVYPFDSVFRQKLSEQYLWATNVKTLGNSCTTMP